MESGNQPLKYNGDEDGGSSNTLKIIVAVIVLAVIGAIVAWILIDRSGNDSAATTTSTTTVTIASIGPKTAASSADLSAFVADVGHPVYWAGAIAGQTPEVTQTTDGRVYVRYLPQGVKVGDPRADFLIVATYPFQGAYDALKKVSNGKEVEIAGGGIAVVSESNPTSVHVAYPDVEYQIEVYDPSAQKSLEVATSGTVQPVP